MKKLGKFSLSFSAMMLMTNKIVYATTEATDEGIPSKYIFIGIAVLVILLLLFLGYRMDTKGEEITVPKASKKSNKKYNDLMASSNDAYEEDNINYEMDHNVNTKDLMDSTEYEDDEDSLFTTMSDNDDSNLYETPTYNYEDDEEIEDAGEEFDTSIIDNIDDEIYEDDIEEDDEEYVDNTKNTPKSFDETMVFNNPISNLSGSNLEDEIDNLDNFDDFEDDEIEKDPFIEELNNFKEPESTFEGFSVANNEDVEEVEPKKPLKKYTKVKKEEAFDDMLVNNVSTDEDFLAQMEKNLQKNQEEREAKKVTRKTTTRKKKEE